MISRRAAMRGMAGLTVATASSMAGCAGAQTPKPFCNIGVIGHQGHGKTVLSRAIAKLFGEASALSGVEPGAVAYSEFQTANRHYAGLDCSGAAAFIKPVMIAMSQMDAAILVVSTADGPMPQTREHILLARQMGVKSLVVFISKADLVDDAELIELVTLEVRDLLSAYAFPGDEIPVVVGSARAALEGRDHPIGRDSIRKLMAEVDRYVPQPVRSVDRPFLMPVEDVFWIAGRGTVVTGRVERGRLAIGDAVEIVGLRPTKATTCNGVEMFRKLLDEARAGDNVGILMPVARDEVERGQVLCAPGSVTAYQRFEAETYVLTSEEGGRQRPLGNGYRAQFHFRTLDITGAVRLGQSVRQVSPGDAVMLDIELVAPVAIETGLRFVFREAGRTVGVGMVARVVA